MPEIRPALALTHALLRQITRHAQRCLPEESCGLAGGVGRCVHQVILVENELHSPTRFRMAPAAQLAALQSLESAGLELLAIFHSHPQGPDHPSDSDVAEFHYPETIMLIVSPLCPREMSGAAPVVDDQYWKMNAYSIDQQRVTEVEWTVWDERNE